MGFCEHVKHLTEFTRPYLSELLLAFPTHLSHHSPPIALNNPAPPTHATPHPRAFAHIVLCTTAFPPLDLDNSMLSF